MRTLPAFALAALFCAPFAGFAPTSAPVGVPARSDAAGATTMGWTTLYARDFVRHGMSLETGAYGAVVRDHQVFNEDTELEYGNYVQGSFTVGIQGDEVGAILDLGTKEELATRYGYEETVGSGRGFASIHREPYGIVLWQDVEEGSFQVLREAVELQHARLSAKSSAAVRTGHVYLVRIGITGSQDDDRLYKLLVTEHRPGESVTFVWAAID